MGNSLLCHYIDNCFKKGIILWGQKHCDWGGGKVEEWGVICPPPVTMLKKALSGPDGDDGYLSLNVRQMSVFYRRFSKHSNKVSLM